jgi:hypothetical protein
MATLIRRPKPPAPAAAPAHSDKALPRRIIPIREAALAYVKSVAAQKPQLAATLHEIERDDWSHAQVIIRKYAEKVKNPKSAIRAKCIECSGGSYKEVQECRVTQCALYPFRTGENPFHKLTKERLARQHGETVETTEDTDDAGEDDDEEV